MRTFKIRSAALFAAAALAMAGSPASQARELRSRPAPGSERELQPASAGPACVPTCADDASPCDPVYFKRADGRCAGYHRGRR